MRWLSTLIIASTLTFSVHAKAKIDITVSFKKREIVVPVRSGITLGALIRIAHTRFGWHEEIKDYTQPEWDASFILLRGDRISLKRSGTELINHPNQILLLTDEKLSIEIQDGDTLRASPLSTL